MQHNDCPEEAGALEPAYKHTYSCVGDGRGYCQAPDLQFRITEQLSYVLVDLEAVADPICAVKSSLHCCLHF